MRSRHCKEERIQKSLGNWEDGGAMNLSQENCLMDSCSCTCDGWGNGVKPPKGLFLLPSHILREKVVKKWIFCIYSKRVGS